MTCKCWQWACPAQEVDTPVPALFLWLQPGHPGLVQQRRCCGPEMLCTCLSHPVVAAVAGPVQQLCDSPRTSPPLYSCSLVIQARGWWQPKPGWLWSTISESLASAFSSRVLCIDPSPRKSPFRGPGTYQSTSKPLLATTRPGMWRVCRGSTRPSVGLMAREAMPKTGICNTGHRYGHDFLKNQITLG